MTNFCQYSYFNSSLQLCCCLLQRMDDTSGPVRDATAEALGTLLKVMGERPLNPFIEQLDKIKMDKASWIVIFSQLSY